MRVISLILHALAVLAFGILFMTALQTWDVSMILVSGICIAWFLGNTTMKWLTRADTIE